MKVNYNKETGLIEGYYPDSFKYKSIPEPYIEIADKEQVLSKTMCVLDGVYQEYIKPVNIQLEDLKASKISTCQAYLVKTDVRLWKAIDQPELYKADYEANYQSNREEARIAINDLEDLTTLEQVEAYDITKFEI